MSPPRKRGYVTWNSQMDAILTSTLLEQINEGNKGDRDFESQAYQAVADKLRAELGISVTIDHVKNRIKIRPSLLLLCCLRWAVGPAERWMQAALSVRQKKQVTGDGAEQHEESATAMETKIEGTSASETSSGGSNKKLKRDRLANAVSSFAESFKEYVSKAQGPLKSSSREIYDIVSSILGLSRQQVLKAVKIFMSGPVEEFDMLKNLPEQEKLDWVLLCIND
ncbi:Frizzled-4 [Bienertia sinuspersici]